MKSNVTTKIVAIGTANPTESYSQEEILERFGIKNKKLATVFKSSHIQRRNLCLPKPELNVKEESQAELIKKHLSESLNIGEQAILAAIADAKIGIRDIKYICVVTSTGFLCPGLSAHLIGKMNFSCDCQRCDIVGMGCNAGLNGLNVVSNWAFKNRGKYGLLLCVEICSALYVNDGTMNSAVVNSLFGDGAAAAIVSTETNVSQGVLPSLLEFDSYIASELIDSMKIVWDEQLTKYSFMLSADIPYFIGRNIEKAINSLLPKFNLHIRDISHWIVHSGGKKVLDAIQYNLNLSTFNLRHSISILKNHGNMSSASFLFSFKQILEQNLISDNQYGVAITMGPGVQIETALLHWRQA